MSKNEIKLEIGETGETPGLCDMDSKEYEDLNGFYINISYRDDIFSIIVYNLELLDEKKFEIEIEYDDLLKKHTILKNYRTMQKIFDFFNDIIEKNNYKILQEEKFLKFYFYLTDKTPNKEEDKIGFILKVDKKKDKNEYIKFLCKSLRKSRSENIEKKLSKSEIKFNDNHFKLSNENTISKEKTKNEIKQETIDEKIFVLNCDKCPLIPEIHLDNKKTNLILYSRCQNGHVNNKIDLLNYLENGKKFSKINFKCNCPENQSNSSNLNYCDKCQIIFCKICSEKEHPDHKTIPVESMNFYCIEHMNQFSSFCKNCCKNLCSNCLENHKDHDIYNFDIFIIFESEFNKIIQKSENIISRLKEYINLLDEYQKEFIEKINKLKNTYQTEIYLINNFINNYSKCLHDYIFNYQVIQNLDNIDKFSFDEGKILNKDDSFNEKTQKLINFFNEVETEINNKNIKLIKSHKNKETIYSMCFCEKNKCIIYGLEKKIEILDTYFNSITSFSKLDNKIAYIRELWDGKILVIDLHKNIKILELKNDNVSLYKSIETKDERNFVGIGLSNKNIVCGGNRYLSIIGKGLLTGYKMINSLDLEGFISNVVEIDSESFLVGQSNSRRIIVFNNKNFKELYKIDNICLRGNNYSIAKLSDKFVGITGYEKKETRKACLFLLSLESKQICKKFYSNFLESFSVIIKFNENEIIIGGTGFDRDDHSDIIILSLENNSNKINIKKICEFKRALCDTFEATIVFKNLMIASDSSSNLKYFEIK